MDQDAGTKAGVNQLLTKIAGMPAAIPAISHDSASLSRVGIPIHELDDAHHAYTGMEKRIRVIGKARTKEIIRPKSPPSISKIATTKDIQRHKTKTLQIQKDGGVSIIESSLTKNLFILVGIGDWIEPPSGIGCA